MRVLAAAVPLLICLASCAGSDTHVRMLEGGGNIRIEPSQSKEFDYVVRIGNGMDLGYDPDNPETRNSTALQAIKAQCPDARVVGEQIVNALTGPLAQALGRPAREYFIQIKCRPDVADAKPPVRRAKPDSK